jgi:uncharacterized membrane protein YeaQ/YmgE (transglycosylase-associated protein family)
MILNIVVWCLFGLIAGAVAEFIMPGKDPGGTFNLRGFVITTLIGLGGAVVGGFISSNLFGLDVTGFNLTSFAIAIAGALLLLILYRVAVRFARKAT